MALGAAAVLAVATGPAWTQESPVRFVVDTADDTVDTSPGDGVCADANGKASLRAAIQEANALGTRVQIVLSGDHVYSLSIPGRGEDDSAQGDLDIHGEIAIVVAGDRAWVEGADLDRVFDVHSGARLTVRDVGLDYSRVVGEHGGAVRCRGSLRMDRVRSYRAFAEGLAGNGLAGGCIFNDGGSVEVHESRFRGHADFGGGIASRGGTTTIANCRFEGCSAVEDGGAIHAAEETDVTLIGCLFTSNNARSRGGALSNGTGTMTIDRCTLDENHAFGDLDGEGGGGVFNAGGTVSITRSRVVYNDAVGDRGAGGGVLNSGGRVEIARSSVIGNYGFHSGGGVASLSGEFVATDCRFTHNIALFYDISEPGSGAGVHLTGPTDATIERCTFAHNRAYADGAAIWNGGTGHVRVVRSRFVRNLANYFAIDKFPEDEPLHPVGHGGALFHQGTNLEIERSRFDRNRAVGDAGTGGAIFNAGTGLSMSLSVITGNSARSSGGGLDLDDGSETLLDRVSVIGNAASGTPGVGGGIQLRGTARLTMGRGQIVRNRARSAGGGLWMSEGGAATLKGTRISGNQARSGRQVFNDGGSLTVTRRAE